MSHESTDGDVATEPQTSTTNREPSDEPPAVAEETAGETELGISENVAGALAYFWGFVTGGLLYAVETENEFVRFHAAQSIVLSVGLFCFFVGFTVFQFFVGFLLGDIMIIGFLISIGFSFLWLVIGFGTFLLYLYLMITAFRGRQKRLPIVASISETHLL
ncbi:hypothetical protein D8Y22_14655 [Salinadaptatus halalkaliphilus]|uniref:DUF4870 domain-containing protein n=1 Tax=Salinadaptatus halalkaliphilus TaxID=2419781 RepID=A0A4S3TNM6_9EURY|nr:hypothetical protein [Salinadaptatus halalkaliphilus]THE64148.1 hypothetical protein D8Y22_14655 [Salinadaptatus halalkaliphilus]